MNRADCGFSGMKHIFIQTFVQVDPHVDNTTLFYGLLGLNSTVLELEYKKLFCIALIGWEQTIYGAIT